MRKTSEWFLVFLFALVQASRDPLVGINQLIAQIDRVQNSCVVISALDQIKESLIFNLRYHDQLNLRELKNVYECYLSEYREVMNHLERIFGYCAPFHDESGSWNRLEMPRQSGRDQKLQRELAREVWKRKVSKFNSRDEIALKVISWQTEQGLVGLPELNRASLQLEDLRMILDGETPKNLAAEIERVLLRQRVVNKIRFGEFFKAADTLAHSIQTRLQHTARHARSLAETSTALLKVLSVREPNFLLFLKATTNAVQNLARLSQKELEAHPETAHVELFIGAFENLLVISSNLSSQPEEPQLEFTLNALVHTLESIFPGTVLVKQALAIEALHFRDNFKKFNYTVNFESLQDLQTLRFAQTSQVIDEIVAWLRRAAFAMRDDDIHHILQMMGVRALNIFRMSHESNLQVLFLHLCSTLNCIGLDCEGFVRDLVIDAYNSSEATETTVDVLQNKLEEVQIMCLQKLLDGQQTTWMYSDKQLGNKTNQQTEIK